MPVQGREVGAILKRGGSPDGFGTWTTEWSSEGVSPRIAISVGSIKPGSHSQRDGAVIARCASTVAATLRSSNARPVFSAWDDAFHSVRAGFPASFNTDAFAEAS